MATPMSPRHPAVLRRTPAELAAGRERFARLARCVYQGPATGRQEPCLGCGQHGRLADVYTCAIHGETSGWRHMKGVRPCQGCNDYVKPAPGLAPDDPYRYVAPLGVRQAAGTVAGASAEGLPGQRRPWDYPYTVALPHLDTLEHLAACVDLLRLQDAPPYILVLDTGSPPAVLTSLEKMRAPDLEIHAVRSHAYRHPSQPVAVAMDLAFALCRTDVLIALHTDVFLRTRDALSWLAAHVSKDCPVAGWRMSPRRPGEDWRRCVSHTFTAFYMPTMRRAGVNWSMEPWFERHGPAPADSYGWPDTETGLSLSLERAGIVPRFLGDEPNFERHITERFDHPRSLTGARVWTPPEHELRRRVEGYAAEALADARARAAEWRKQPPAE